MPNPWESVATLIADSGGRVVGKTRLQKTAYLLELMNLGFGFDFDYHHFGPFSAQLAEATDDAVLIGLIKENESMGSYGVPYSVFQSSTNPSTGELAAARQAAVQEMSRLSAIDLEIAATAAFVMREQEVVDPWIEVSRLKPTKTTLGRIEIAKNLLRNLKLMD